MPWGAALLLAQCFVDPIYSMHIAQKADNKTYYHPTANRSYCQNKQCFTPDVTLQKYQKKGIASWYGRPFHGRKTSTGERYNMFSYTAASTTLPLPSYAKVTNLANNTSVIVKINDRGPFVKNRLIDLSYGAAHKLGFSDKGIAEVHVQWIHPSKIAALKTHDVPHTPHIMKSRNTTFTLFKTLHDITYNFFTGQHTTPTQHSHGKTSQHNYYRIHIESFKKPLEAQQYAHALHKSFPQLPTRILQHTKGYHLIIGPMHKNKAQSSLAIIRKKYKQAYITAI